MLLVLAALLACVIIGMRSERFGAAQSGLVSLVVLALVVIQFSLARFL
jgi:hypothetical protein